MGTERPPLSPSCIMVTEANRAEPLSLVLIQSQQCPRKTSIFSDRALPSRPRSPTYPLGTELNRVPPFSRSYRISKHSVNATPPPLPPSGAHPIVYQKPFYAYA